MGWDGDSGLGGGDAGLERRDVSREGWGLMSPTPHPHPNGVPLPGGPGPSLVSSRRGRILPGRRSALVRRGRDELFSAAQHQAVSPAGWAGGAVRREGGGRRGWEQAPCSPRTSSWPSSCRTVAQVRGSTGPGHDVGRGWQGAQKWWRPELGCRAGVAWLCGGRRDYVTGAWCVCLCVECLPALVCGKG